MVLRLTQADARRIAVRAQLLEEPRPTSVLEVVRRLTLLQIDPTAAIAPNADLVLWSRLGSAYDPAELRKALEHDRSLFELDALIRPMEDLPLYLAELWSAPLREGSRTWLEANAAFHRDVLARLREAGPLRSRDIPDTAAVPWRSTGWSNDRNVTQLLEILVHRGEVAISRREGRERFFDLAERVYPDVPAVTVDEARRMRDQRRLHALGIAREKAAAQAIEPIHVGAAGEPAEVEGVKGVWRVHPDYLGGELEPRTALLSPFDRLLHDRVRMTAFFEFEYALEMYKPAAQRRWGYFALPVLHGDRLVGKLDALADRKAGVLRVHALHEDQPFTAEMRDAVDEQLDDLCRWLGLERS